jgi:predicted ABC-type ATPase
VADQRQSSSIYVLAGTNGAGKSSIIGAMFLKQGIEHFNPDEATRRILAANPSASLEQANSAAWYEGKRLLERAISEKLRFAFETTLGGNTITALLRQTLHRGLEVRIWYVGLNSPDLHVARVKSRVEHGGHDIPESKIRERYIQSRLNLLELLPLATEVRIYDNSEDGDPKVGNKPKPKLLLHTFKGRVTEACDLKRVPGWAKPFFVVAARLNS